jgi:signal transduction histidine kinase/CheY-like chemotaxis protein
MLSQVSTPFRVVVGAVVLAWLAVGISCVSAREQLFIEAGESTSLIASSFIEHVDRSLQTVDLATQVAREGFAHLPAGPQRTEAAHELLQSIAADVPQIRVLLFIGSDGQTIAFSTGDPERLDYRDRSFWAHHQYDPSPAPFLSEPMVGLQTGRLTFNWSRRIDGPDGSFAGVVVASIEPDYFRDFYQSIRRHDGDWLTVMRKDGTILARFPGTEWIGAINTGQLITRILPTAPNGTLRQYRGTSIVPRLLSYRSSALFPILVTVARPISDIDSIWLFESLQRAVVALIIGGLVLWAAWNTEMRTRDLLDRSEASERATQRKSEFLASMSHEIRTPMNAVIGFADVLLRSPLDGAQRQQVLMIRESGRALVSLVDDILDMSKIEADRIEFESVPLSPRTLVGDVLTTLREQAERRALRLESEIGADVPDWILGDPMRLRQVLLNLVGNAIKFTDCGQVVIAVRTVEDGMLRWEVADTGIGIEPDKIDRLFQPFGQTDRTIARRFGGTGLGLMICKRLIELMGGRIGVRSVAGRGSTFWFETPLNVAAVPTGAAIISQSATALANARVLLVDDLAANRLLVKALLEDRVASLLIVENGEAALEALRTMRFDVVLMDVEMETMDGLEATRRIRAAPPPVGDVPVLAITAHLMREETARCRAAGMDDVLAKPIDALLLESKIAEWSQRRSELQVAQPAAPVDETLPDTALPA